MRYDLTKYHVCSGDVTLYIRSWITFHILDTFRYHRLIIICPAFSSFVFVPSISNCL